MGARAGGLGHESPGWVGGRGALGRESRGWVRERGGLGHESGGWVRGRGGLGHGSGGWVRGRGGLGHGSRGFRTGHGLQFAAWRGRRAPDPPECAADAVHAGPEAAASPGISPSADLDTFPLGGYLARPSSSGPLAQLVEQRTLNPLADSSSLSWPTHNSFNELEDSKGTGEAGNAAAICSPICTTLDEGTLEAAIDRLTRALASAPDAAIGELVAERAALREELRALRDARAGVVRLDDERTRRGRPR